MMTKVLMLGFSVTEMDTSYVPRLKSLVSERRLDLEIDHCGIGGITTEALPYFVDRIIAERPNAEIVVFEITTSYVRQVYQGYLDYNPDYLHVIWDHIAALIQKTRLLGRDVAFVNLPRKDVSYKGDFLEAIISQVCVSYGVPILSISTDLMLRRVPLDSILMDEVHPSPVGAELYAEKIASFLQSLVRYRCVPQVEQATFDSFAFKDMPNAKQLNFSRHGFKESYIEIHGGEQVTIKLPEPRLIEGIAILAGPKSGWVTVATDKPHVIVFYDEHCYYNRMITSVQPLGYADTITVALSEDVPAISLLKGERDEGPRCVGLFYLFHQPKLS